MENNYILGIDLGITSVGFAVVDKDSLDIIKYGVRLFDERDSEDNLNRRTKRGQRRLKRRKLERIVEIKRLINNNILKISDLTNLSNITDIKIKGLSNKLSPNELANVLINYAKRRGSSLDVVIDEDDKEGGEMSTSLSNNTKALVKDNIYICQLQKRWLEEGKLRGHKNVFRSEDYVKEIKKILSNQDLSSEINDKIIKIISRRRHFSEGPGDINSPTKYGRFKGEYDEQGNPIIHNLIDDMRGKCSIYPNEFRMAKNAYSACLFNLLNDLNNLTIIDNGVKRKITKDEKLAVIKHVNTKGNITFKELTKILKVDIDSIQGYRIDKKEKPLITTFDLFYKVKKIFSSFGNDKIEPLLVDDIAEVLTKTLIYEERFNGIKNIFENANINVSDAIIEQISNISKINGYHSLSKKAILEINEIMLEESKNQQEIITANSLGDKISFEGKANIVFDNSLILSSVARRAHLEAIKVINELRHEYGEFAKVVLETTRDKNLKEQRQSLIKIQAANEQANKEAEKIATENGIGLDKLNSIKKLKLRLYKEQEGKCIYTGKPIDLNRLLNDDSAYQIEHIIPYAISFDNSYMNKSLAEADANQLKGKNTPFYYFKSGKAYGNIRTFDQFKIWVESLNMPQRKKYNLLTMEDYSKWSNMEDFVNRNLNDTSYAIRSLMNTLQNYYRDNNINTVVRTIKGKQTSTFRSIGGVKKDRDFYIHHAIDALIIAALGSSQTISKAYYKETFDSETGEILVDPLDDQRIRKFLKTLKKINDDFVLHPDYSIFSYKIDTKVGRQISDETIYSTRKVDGKDWVVKKYKDIYGKEGEALTGLFEKGESTKLLMYKNDIETYNIFKKIYEDYKNVTVDGKKVKNVFAYYYELTGEKIRKYSKKNNGPIITSVKYVNEILGNHIDISKNYNTKDKKVVKLQLSPYRTDIYKNADGVYKFVTIRGYHVKQVKDGFEINKDLYESLKASKGIDDTFEFMFSLNRNNIIMIRKDGEENYYKFIATNNDLASTIECKYISMVTKDYEKNSVKRLIVSIGAKIELIEKFNVSPAGKWSKVYKETLKLKY